MVKKLIEEQEKSITEQAKILESIKEQAKILEKLSKDQ